MGVCVPGPSSSHENDYHREQYNKNIPIKCLKSENDNNLSGNDWNMRLYKRKFIVKEDNSTEELSSSVDKSNEKSTTRIKFHFQRSHQIYYLIFHVRTRKNLINLKRMQNILRNYLRIYGHVTNLRRDMIPK